MFQSDHGLSSSPGQSHAASPVMLRHCGDDMSLRSLRMLHRTLSEDIKVRRRESFLSGTSPLAQSRHLSSSQLGQCQSARAVAAPQLLSARSVSVLVFVSISALGLSGSVLSQSDSGTNLLRMRKSGLGKSAPSLYTGVVSALTSQYYMFYMCML